MGYIIAVDTSISMQLSWSGDVIPEAAKDDVASRYDLATEIVQAVMNELKRLDNNPIMHLYYLGGRNCEQVAAIDNDDDISEILESKPAVHFNGAANMGNFMEFVSTTLDPRMDDRIIIITDCSTFEGDINYRVPCETRFVVINNNRASMDEDQLKELDEIAATSCGMEATDDNEEHYHHWFLHDFGSADGLAIDLVSELFEKKTYTLEMGHLKTQVRVDNAFHQRSFERISILGFLRPNALVNMASTSCGYIYPVFHDALPGTEVPSTDDEEAMDIEGPPAANTETKAPAAAAVNKKEEPKAAGEAAAESEKTAAADASGEKEYDDAAAAADPAAPKEDAAAAAPAEKGIKKEEESEAEAKIEPAAPGKIEETESSDDEVADDEADSEGDDDDTSSSELSSWSESDDVVVENGVPRTKAARSSYFGLPPNGGLVIAEDETEAENAAWEALSKRKKMKGREKKLKMLKRLQEAEKDFESESEEDLDALVETDVEVTDTEAESEARAADEKTLKEWLTAHDEEEDKTRNELEAELQIKEDEAIRIRKEQDEYRKKQEADALAAEADDGGEPSSKRSRLVDSGRKKFKVVSKSGEVGTYVVGQTAEAEAKARALAEAEFEAREAAAALDAFDEPAAIEARKPTLPPREKKTKIVRGFRRMNEREMAEKMKLIDASMKRRLDHMDRVEKKTKELKKLKSLSNYYLKQSDMIREIDQVKAGGKHFINCIDDYSKSFALAYDPSIIGDPEMDEHAFKELKDEERVEKLVALQEWRESVLRVQGELRLLLGPFREQRGTKTTSVIRKDLTAPLLAQMVASGLVQENLFALCVLNNGVHAILTAEESIEGMDTLMISTLPAATSITFPATMPHFGELMTELDDTNNIDNTYLTMKIGKEEPTYSSSRVAWFTEDGIEADLVRTRKNMKKMPERIHQFYNEMNRIRKHAYAVALPKCLPQYAKVIAEEARENGDEYAPKHADSIKIFFNNLAPYKSIRKIMTKEL